MPRHSETCRNAASPPQLGDPQTQSSPKEDSLQPQRAGVKDLSCLQLPFPVPPSQDSRGPVTGSAGVKADGALPLQNVGREGLGANVRHRVFLDPQVVLLQPLGRCRRSPLTAAAAHLLETNTDVHKGPNVPSPLLQRAPAAVAHAHFTPAPRARPGGRPDSPTHSDSKGLAGSPLWSVLL